MIKTGLRLLEQFLKQGASKVEVDLPYLDEILGAHRAIIFSEAAAYHRPFLASRAEMYGADIRPLLECGAFVPVSDYLQAQRARRVIRTAWNKVLAEIDCLFTPAAPIAAPAFNETTAKLPGGEKPLVRALLDPFLPFNYLGYPAVVMPCGVTKENMPIGLQLVGKPGQDEFLLNIATGYQQKTEWHLAVAEV